MKRSVVVILVGFLASSAWAQSVPKPQSEPVKAEASSPLAPREPLVVWRATEAESRMVDAVYYRAMKELLEREERRWDVTKWFYTFVAALVALVAGYFGLFASRHIRDQTELVAKNILRDAEKVSKDEIKAQSESHVAQMMVDRVFLERVAEAVEARRRSNLSTQEQMRELDQLVEKLDKRDGFSNTERDEVMTGLKALKARLDAGDTTANATLGKVLPSVLRSFAAADQVRQLVEIDSMFWQMIKDRKISSAIIVMVQYLGLRVTGGVADKDMADMFTRYAEAAHEVDLKELALPYQMVAAHIGNKHATVGELLAVANSLKPGEKRTLGEILYRYERPGMVGKVATEEIVTASKNFIAFNAAMKDQLIANGIEPRAKASKQNDGDGQSSG